MPFRQTTGCFDHASVYVVLKETDAPDFAERRADRMSGRTGEEIPVFDGFKLILYLCGRHDEELKYLLLGSELRISKRQILCSPQIR